MKKLLLVNVTQHRKITVSVDLSYQTIFSRSSITYKKGGPDGKERNPSNEIKVVCQCKSIYHLKLSPVSLNCMLHLEDTYFNDIDNIYLISSVML